MSVDKEIRIVLKHLKRRELKKAEQALNQILTKFPKNRRAILILRQLNSAPLSISNSTHESQLQIENLINLYKSGRFSEIIDLSHSFKGKSTKLDVIHKVFGAAYSALKKSNEAMTHYKIALGLGSQDADLYYNMGVELQCIGNFNSAILHYQKAIYLRPNFFNAITNLGNVLKNTGQLDAAIDSYKSALRIFPNDAAVLNNVGAVMRDLGDLDVAIEYCNRALKINPNFAMAHYNLGLSFYDQKNFNEAINSYQKAILFNPEYSQAYNNLGNSYKAKGENKLALESYRKSLKLDPDNLQTYSNLGIVLENITFDNFSVDLSDLFLKILNKTKLVSPRKLIDGILSLIKHHPKVLCALNSQDDGLAEQNFKSICEDLGNIPLLLKIMTLCPISDLQLEKLFYSLRKGLLLSISNTIESDSLIAFTSSLAQLNFINDYVSKQTAIERAALNLICLETDEGLKRGITPSSISLTCIASYQPLRALWHHKKIQFCAELKYLEKLQILDFYEENDLKKQISNLSEIKDITSVKVKRQYEENPYPKWIYTRAALQSQTLSEIAKQLQLKGSSSEIFNINNPEILIAGCGTGEHAVRTRTRFTNSKVLAIDLSLQSLSYAQRKTLELEINNIDYRQGDILNLAELNQQFDIIESSGVLHHMENPMQGWQILTDCLKPNGIMKIALYSETARRGINLAREEIKQKGILAEKLSMVEFRAHILERNSELLSALSFWKDFFCLNEFRDMLFNFKEHQFSILEIQNNLKELKLEFLGFELAHPDIKSHFIQKYSEQDIYDLTKWNQFEIENNNTFTGMYQFWCKKE